MTVLVAIDEWLGPVLPSAPKDVLVILLLAVLSIGAGWGRLIFVLIGTVLMVMAILSREDSLRLIDDALGSAAFITAFLTAMATLRHASSTSPAIEACGSFLARQPPGRRYGALTLGGHLFGVLLNYGSLVLLGSLAEANARREPNAEIRGHRMRRMLLAVQRGFVSTLTWSPLAFALAISTSLVQGARWADAVWPCLISGLLLAALGWVLDTIFKPRLSAPPPPRAEATGSWLSLWPLLALLAILVLSIGGIQGATGVRTVGVVMVVVPALAFAWLVLQQSGQAPLLGALHHSGRYVAEDLPGYRGELLLLMMAGFIGTLGSQLISPLLGAAAIDFSTVPAWQILIAIVWLVPLTGQMGMNPILSVSLFVPLLPVPEAMGLTPSDMIVAITAGWALGASSSPYAATTLLIGAMGQVSALHVGLRWNGLFTVLGGAVLSLWVVAVATFW